MPAPWSKRRALSSFPGKGPRSRHLNEARHHAGCSASGAQKIAARTEQPVRRRRQINAAVEVHRPAPPPETGPVKPAPPQIDDERAIAGCHCRSDRGDRDAARSPPRRFAVGIDGRALGRGASRRHPDDDTFADNDLCARRSHRVGGRVIDAARRLPRWRWLHGLAVGPAQRPVPGAAYWLEKDREQDSQRSRHPVPQRYSERRLSAPGARPAELNIALIGLC